MRNATSRREAAAGHHGGFTALRKTLQESELVHEGGWRSGTLDTRGLSWCKARRVLKSRRTPEVIMDTGDATVGCMQPELSEATTIDPDSTRLGRFTNQNIEIRVTGRQRQRTRS